MYQGRQIAAVLPALNEEQAIAVVLDAINALKNSDEEPIIDQIVVCDNGSSDATAEVAAERGAKVVYQPQPGYGIACLTALKQLSTCDIVLFVDADDSCHLPQAVQLIQAIVAGDDLAIGSRTQGRIDAGALTLPQRFGNTLATWLIRQLWQQQITDLGPFRAVDYAALQRLNMQDQTFGWTVEMQVKAIQQGMQIGEYPVDSKKRIGVSKISGTLRGVIGAGVGIIGTIIKLKLSEYRQQSVAASHPARKEVK